MNYLALGDSISIDTYTGTPDGGAASQFARLVGATAFQNLTRDGRTTAGVLDAWGEVTIRPDVVTLTAGGNDFLQGAFAVLNGRGAWEAVSGEPLANLERISDRLAAFGCPVLLSTVYDPTDGDDSLIASFGMTQPARAAFVALNEGIRALARRRGFLLSDLEALFHGHGAAAPDPWIVSHIEPNLAGATAIARHWHGLYRLQ
jgi:lysophospholipase L1-like esterase